MAEIDIDTKLKLYMLIVSRYKDVISKNEESSITEIRQRISPYNDFVKNLRDSLIKDIHDYDYDKNFLTAVQKGVDYIRGIKNFEFLLTFWMSFEEMDELKAADIMDQALLLTALLRSLGSENVKVHVTRSKKIYVGFEYKGEKLMINPGSGSLLRGDDIDNIFQSDNLSYSFNDLSYENFEEA